MLRMAHDGPNGETLLRYERQVLFDGLGLEGQRALMGGKVLIVGLGGLGSWVAELLVRGGVGFLRLVDDDRVELSNIHRQALYDEADAGRSLWKVDAAAERLREIRGDVRIETVTERVGPGNIERLAEDVGVILDGTDNFPTRFLINDAAVKLGRPWVFAGVVGAEAQTMTVLPGQTACLRCILAPEPPQCPERSCRTVGVVGPAVSAVASFQAAEAMKILAGRAEKVSPYLLKFDLWSNTLQRVDVGQAARRADCPCCGQHEYEFLEP